MSSYTALTQHPVTKEWKKAFWADDYFGKHNYGVNFGDDIYFDPRECDLTTKDEPTEPTPLPPLVSKLILDALQLLESELGHRPDDPMYHAFRDKVLIPTVQAVAQAVADEMTLEEGLPDFELADPKTGQVSVTINGRELARQEFEAKKKEIGLS